MEDLKKLLKTGVFGVMTNGNRFVVANDRLIYQSGGFDSINAVIEDIDKIVDACSFNNLECCLKRDHHILYDRKKDGPKSFKVVCVECKRDEHYFTVGKIYTWENDTLKNDNNFTYEGSMVGGTDIDEWWLSKWYKFIKIVEEKEGN